MNVSKTHNTSPCFLIFGFGYTAKALAPRLTSLGFNVIGTTRALHEKSKRYQGVTLLDIHSPEIQRYLSLSTHVLISIPPINTMTDLVLTNFSDSIKKEAPHLQWIGYLSSTGVYGDHQGKWVDEETTCIPHTPTAIKRLKIEQDWVSFAQSHQLPLHVFRLSGIYGTGRCALERLKLGKKNTIFKEGQVFCRIHVEDIAATLLASIQSPKPLSIYNVSDDEPAASHVVVNYAASLMQLKLPPPITFSDASLSAMEQEFYSNNRRVSNAKIRQELHVVLKYPSFREGLTYIWRDSFALK